MNNFGVGYAEDLKNGCNSHGEAIILNPSRRDTTIIHYSIFIIHSNSKSLDRAINRNLAFPLIHMGCIYYPRPAGADIIAKTLLGVNDTEEGFALSYIGLGGVAVAHHALY